MIRKILLVIGFAVAREQMLYSERPRPTVGAVDKLCAPSSVNNGTCLIQNKDIRFTYDFVYQTNLNLVLDNSAVVCVTPSSLPCNIYLSLNSTNSLTLQQNSQISGKQVIVQAQKSQITVLDSSTVSVSGQSLNQNGTQARVQDGAQFVGQGGSCGTSYQNYTTFGNYNMLPDFNNLASILNQMGSVGYQGDAETAGGGRIIIIADSFNFTGSSASIQANAFPLKTTAQTSPYSLVGGSGGYIYLSTLNIYNQNQIASTFSVEAQGGYGTNGNYGGSGGVVVIDGNVGITSAQVTTQGGAAYNSTLNVDGCGNGAAGTLYFIATDTLIVDNEGKMTPKKTVLKATTPKSGTNPQIGSSVLVDGGASVYVDIQKSIIVELPKLELTDGGTLGFSSGLVQLSILLGQVNISPVSTLDLSLIPSVTLQATDMTLTLGNVIYGQQLLINGGKVFVEGSIRMFNESNSGNLQNSQVVFDVQSLSLIGQNQSLISTTVFVHSVGALTIDAGYNVSSYLKHTCYQNQTVAMFSCVPLHSLHSTLTAATFVQNYNKVYGSQVKNIIETAKNITQGFNIYLMSETSISIVQSTIQAPRIGLCAPNVITADALVDAAGRGCPAGYGIGKGDAQINCSGSGGAYGGFGGFGISFSNQSCLSKPQPYFTPAEAIYEGSSGGSAIAGSYLGGSGGGLIWMTASEKVTLNASLITVAGQKGSPYNIKSVGSGGGSGGGLQIVTKSIAGDNSTLLDLSGGDGSLFGGGGGSGGRFVAVLLENFNSTNYIQQSIEWNGTFSLAGGKGGARSASLTSGRLQARSSGGDGQDGTTTQTKCFAGFSGPFCKPCPVGFFKYNFGFGVCQPCQNKPKDAYYSAEAQSTEMCAYECSIGLESVQHNPNCLNTIDLQIERVGGTYGFLIAFALTLALTLVLSIVIAARSKCIRRGFKDEYATVYDGVLFRDSYEEEFGDDEGFIGPASLYMRDSDIWSHTHRMYLIGENSISYPWFLTKDFPSNALATNGQQNLIRMINSEQHVMDWSFFQQSTYTFFRVFFPYLAELVHRAYRRSHFRAINQKLYDAFTASDWEDMTGRTCRMQSDKDSRLAYIDFLDYRRNKSNYSGPKLPMTLLLAGNGTLSSPYNLPFLTDPLAKSLVYLNKKQLELKLPPFLQNLNTLLDKLCFYKFNRQTMKDLNDVIEWINCGNNTLFAQLDVKMTLYVFENSYQETEGGNFKQRRRSMPIDCEVFETFPVLFKRLIQHVQLKMLTKKAEIRFGIVIKSVNQQQQAVINHKIRNIQEQLDGKNDLFLELQNTSISCLYSDEDTQEFNTNPKQGSIKGFNKDAQESLLSEMQTSQVTIHGSGQTSEVKIIDKSKRAFDLSPNATKALEDKLRKQRKSCKHLGVRFKSVVYSMWLLMFKTHGKPPQSNLGFTFLMFAFFMALELVLSTIILLHIANPLDQIWTFGFPFLFILPGLTIIAPLFGLFATVCGSPLMLKIYSNMNSSMIINYSLTIAVMLYQQDQIVYQAVVLLLILNKIALSVFGSKVRQHFANPDYAKVMENMQKTLCEIVAADVTGRSHQMAPADRAAMLVNSGKPSLWKDESSGSELGLEEDDQTFGIVPINKLRQAEQQTAMDPLEMKTVRHESLITDDVTKATNELLESQLESAQDGQDL